MAWNTITGSFTLGFGYDYNWTNVNSYGPPSWGGTWADAYGIYDITSSDGYWSSSYAGPGVSGNVETNSDGSLLLSVSEKDLSDYGYGDADVVITATAMLKPIPTPTPSPTPTPTPNPTPPPLIPDPNDPTIQEITQQPGWVKGPDGCTYVDPANDVTVGPFPEPDNNQPGITSAQAGDAAASTSQADNSDAAPSSGGPVDLAKAPQTISAFAKIPTQNYSATKSLTVTPPKSSSGLSVSLVVKSGHATVSGDTVTLTGKGTVVLGSTQGGTTNYKPAPEVTTSFKVD